MTGTKTRLGLLALFLVATVGFAQTSAFLVDEEQAVLRFAGNSAGTAGGIADTTWGAGNMAVPTLRQDEWPSPPGERVESRDAPPPAAMTASPTSETTGPSRSVGPPGESSGFTEPDPAATSTVLAEPGPPPTNVDPPPWVPPRELTRPASQTGIA
jgi:hypothetical protein